MTFAQLVRPALTAAALVGAAGLVTFGALETTRAAAIRPDPGPPPPPPQPAAVAPPPFVPAPKCDQPAAMELWKTCDPIPRTHDAWDEALASGRAGMLELGSNPRSRLRVDGRNYGIYVGGDARVTRVPIAPGAHVLDFIDDAHVYGVRREVVIKPGETKRIVLELRDALAKPVEPGAAWYTGRVNGHPSYTNTAPEETVLPTTPRDK